VQTFPFSGLDRAIIDDAANGFVSILSTRRGRVLGGNRWLGHARAS